MLKLTCWWHLVAHVSAAKADTDLRDDAAHAEAIEALHCKELERKPHRRDIRLLRDSFAPTTEDDDKFRWHLSRVAEDLWFEWYGLCGFQGQTVGWGPKAFTRAMLGTGGVGDDYCFPAHVAAGFYYARFFPWRLSLNEHGEAEDLPLPDWVIESMHDILLKVLMLFAHNRALDYLALAGWPVGSAHVLVVRDVLLRTCTGDVPCMTLEVHEKLKRALSEVYPLRRFALGPDVRALPFEWKGIPVRNARDGCVARAQQGRGPPCQVKVWYMGVHMALFNEIKDMWSRFPEIFNVKIRRINTQESYNPAGDLESVNYGQVSENQPRDSSPKTWHLSLLDFKVHIEEIIDAVPVSMRLRWLLRKNNDVTTNGLAFDATILLCTIPTLACSVFFGHELPVVMYAANPATAQVPSEMFQQFLVRFAEMAENPKNQLLLSNTWSHAQFEYQFGVSFPVIRVHGLYTQAHKQCNGTSPHSFETLVYDRVSPVLARLLETMRFVERHKHPAGRFVHHADTDRNYQTFAKFGAVIFIPGDVEQMAFYEFYSMELPIFIPSAPGRYMWPRLPGERTYLDETCGDFAAWVGDWKITQDLVASKQTGTYYEKANITTLVIECDGTVHVQGENDGWLGRIRPREKLDNDGYSHCLDDPQPGNPHIRLVLMRNHLRLRAIAGNMSCEKETPMTERLDFVVGERMTKDPVQATLWDHAHFASSVWYLDARLPGPMKSNYSPFNLASMDAVWEWAQFMDYFRFPGVGFLTSSVELLSTVASPKKLKMMSGEMNIFNARTLKQSIEQWETVIHLAITHSI